MKNIFVALIGWNLAIACLAACQTWQEQKSDVTGSKDTLTYFKDTRTDLCFAQVKSEVMVQNWSYSIASIAAVPCDKVPVALLK